MLLAFCGLERISSKYQIKTFNSISEKGLKRFPSDKYVLSDDLSSSDAILLRSHPLQSVEMEAGIIAVARAGAGVNNVPVEECSERGIVVFNTPGANANSVKELVLTALLISARDIVGGISYVRSLTPNLGADELNQLVEKEKKLFKGHELKDKKLGVVGLGAIGSMVARAGLDMGMQVVGFDPALSVEAAWRVPSEVRRKNTLGELFGESDFVSLHVPLIEETRGLVDKEVLLAAKRGAVVLNFARDPIVDSEAILEALDNGAIGRYVSDFPVRELVGHDRVIFTPHLGASTSEAEENCAIMAADQLIDFLETGNITNSVNFPKVSMGTRRDVRLAVVNKNVPGMLGQITSLLAAKNVNVADLINKSREELAYNLIDIEQHPDDELLSGLRSLDNVMSVRVISD
jgi:D-3-phosphoglycerate dehydrogenase